MNFDNLITLPNEVVLMPCTSSTGKESKLPEVGSAGAAGLDCFTDEEVTLSSRNYHKAILVPLGFCIAIPRGWVGLLVPRSSTFNKYHLKLANTVGIIDSDYRGEVKANIVLASGVSDKYSQTIPRGTRLVQLVLIPCADYNKVQLRKVASKEELGGTARGEGGFGSTGSKEVNKLLPPVEPRMYRHEYKCPTCGNIHREFSFRTRAIACTNCKRSTMNCIHTIKPV